MGGQTEVELAELFDRSPIGIYRATKAGRLRYANPAFAALLGHTVDALRGLDISELFVDPARRDELLVECTSTGQIDGATIAWRHRDGHTLTVRMFGHIVTVDGEPVIDASVIDLTALEASNARLREQRAELERTATTLDMVVRQVSAIWWIVDRDLVTVLNGGSVRETLGYEPESVRGLSLVDLFAADPDGPRILELHRRAIAGETVRYSVDYRGKLMESTVAPYRIDGAIAGAIGTSMDVTAPRLLERRMVDAQRAESLGVLAGGLAHDFNNLLVAILGNADLGLRDLPAGAPGRDSLVRIRTASLRAAELTGQLLALAGHGNVSSQLVDIAEVTAEIILLSAASLPSTITVDVALPAGLQVRGDPSQIRQVLLNLLSNAREAIGAHRGTITIEGRVDDHDGAAHPDDILTATAGRYATIVVTDSGPGMSPEIRRRAFEPFFTTKEHGHGLGLAAVIGAVRGHGGGVRQRNGGGEGTGGGACFEVRWPIASGAVHTAPPALRTILVIDDEELVRDVVSRMIEDLGYRTITAADGQTGLEIVGREHVDAVLVDMTMPTMSGADVVAALHERWPDLPVVICTGYDRGHHGLISATAFLPKPFRIDALADTLAQLFTRD